MKLYYVNKYEKTGHILYCYVMPSNQGFYKPTLSVPTFSTPSVQMDGWPEEYHWVKGEKGAISDSQIIYQKYQKQFQFSLTGHFVRYSFFTDVPYAVHYYIIACIPSVHYAQFVSHFNVIHQRSITIQDGSFSAQH